jgi:hypothetical protein
MGQLIALPVLEPPEEPRRRCSKKRANGQGSIYQRKDGRWAGAAFVLGSDGNYRRVQVYGSSAEEVDAKLTALKNRSNQGLPADATGWTVGRYADYWLAHVAGPKLRPTTLARYRSLIQQYIAPAIGRKRLPALNPADVRLLLARGGRRPRPGAQRPGRGRPTAGIATDGAADPRGAAGDAQPCDA